MPAKILARLIRLPCYVLLLTLGFTGVAPAHGGRPPHPYPTPTPPPPPQPPPYVPAGTVTPNKQTPTPAPSPTPSPTPSPRPSPTPSPTPMPSGSPSGATPAACGSRTAAAGSTTVARRNRSGTTPSLEDWRLWWGFNKEEFLKLKTRLHDERVTSESASFFFGRRTPSWVRSAERPTVAYVRKLILPVLLESLGAAHPDVRDSACIAVGKVGGPDEIAALVPRIRDKVQAVREAAVIGLGLLRTKQSVPALLAVLNASDQGRMIRGGLPEERLRGCAAIALGLTGDGENRAVRWALMRHSHDRKSRDLRVCSTLGLGLLDYAPDTRSDVAAHLARMCRQAKDDWGRAHAATALGRLFHCSRHVVGTETLALLCRLVRRDRCTHVRRSAVAALGAIDAVATHPDALQLLRHTFARDKDAVVRRFAAIALGRVGRDTECQVLTRTVLGQRDQHAAFAALGLGIWLGRSASDNTYREPARRALRRAFMRMKNPAVRGAVAIALGIARDCKAGRLLLASLQKHRSVQFRGHLAVALGMIRYAAATDYLKRLLATSDNLPELKREVAIGLGLMGDRDIVQPMVRSLQKARSTYVMASITQALGFVGDGSAVKPLVAVVKARRTQSVTRAFACIALGTIGEDEPLPPLSLVFADHNYLASTALLMSLWDIL